MPIELHLHNPEAEIYIFHTEESQDFFMSNLDLTEKDYREFVEYQHPEKKKQWLASRYLLKKASKENRTLFVQKSKLGKPSFSNHTAHFSISHSRNYIGIIISSHHSVAIDIEKIQPKVVSIRKKFLHPEEFHFESSEENMTLIWSAKEAIYKHYHTSELYSFKENIIILSILEKTIQAEIRLKKRTDRITLSYLFHRDLVIVYYIDQSS